MRKLPPVLGSVLGSVLFIALACAGGPRVRSRLRALNLKSKLSESTRIFLAPLAHSEAYDAPAKQSLPTIGACCNMGVRQVNLGGR